MRFSANVKTHSTDNGGKHKLRKMASADKKWGNAKQFYKEKYQISVDVFSMFSYNVAG